MQLKLFHMVKTTKWNEIISVNLSAEYSLSKEMVVCILQKRNFNHFPARNDRGMRFYNLVWGQSGTPSNRKGFRDKWNLNIKLSKIKFCSSFWNEHKLDWRKGETGEEKQVHQINKRFRSNEKQFYRQPNPKGNGGNVRLPIDSNEKFWEQLWSIPSYCNPEEPWVRHARHV